MTRLIILRGNSGSGKSTVARALRSALGAEVALIQQDYLRRDLLGGGQEATVGLLAQVARYCLGLGRHVIIDGILDAARYGPMLRSLVDGHKGRSQVYYFSLPFEETVRRHATRPEAGAFSVEDMRSWYRVNDVLGLEGEEIVTSGESVEQVVSRIM